jgi:hypothetical protein
LGDEKIEARNILICVRGYTIEMDKQGSVIKEK